MLLYHYNKRRLDRLLTRDLQEVVTDKERKNGLEASKFRGDVGPYYQSVSFLLEPAPIDTIGSIFPKDHHTWATGTELWEHEIDLEGQDFYGWSIVEGPISMLFIDYVPWFKNPFYKKLFFRSLALGRTLFSESGKDYRSLEKALRKFPTGTTREAYMRLPKRKDYEDVKNLYAGTVPHLMIYTKSPIQIANVTSVVVGGESVPVSNEGIGHIHSPPSSARW